MTYTPGPWELRGSKLVTDSNGVIIAEHISANYPGTPAGNARLIAAAPDMLHELEETARDLREWDGSPDALEIIRSNIDAAIAKAKGAA